MYPITIDFETTGKDATTAHPIEVGMASPVDGAWDFQQFIALPPGQTIPPETSAIHHIMDEDVRGAPYWPETLITMRRRLELDDALEGLVLVAHNAEYEQGILANTEFAAVPWVCTFKLALIAFPDAPSHSNEALRYWLKIGNNRGRAGQQNPHSALHDAKVTAGIFNVLHGWFHVALVAKGVLASDAEVMDPFVLDVVIGKMIEISKLPAQLPTCPIGDWRGKPWAEVDAGFLRWMINKPIDREDAIYCARQELERRAAR